MLNIARRALAANWTPCPRRSTNTFGRIGPQALGIQQGPSPLGAQRFKTTGPSFSTQETTEIKHLDSLLTQIQAQTDPSHLYLVSVRSPSLWSEHLAHMKETKPKPAMDATAVPTATSDPALPARHMHESFCQVDLPFASDPKYLEKYTNAHGGWYTQSPLSTPSDVVSRHSIGIRTGMLMEHLDSIAGSIAYKHCVS